jgi:hypothetical protein
MIRDGENGLLADFFNEVAIAEKALSVLRDPDAARHMGRAAEKMIVDRYSLEAVLPEMVKMYEQTAAMKSTLPTWPLPPMSNQAPAAPLAAARHAPPVGTVGPVVSAPQPQRIVPPQPRSGPSKSSPFRG